MKKRIILIYTIVIGLSTITLFKQVSAFPPAGFGHSCSQSASMGGMPFGGQMGKVFRMMESLDLDQAQRDEVWNILDEKRSLMRTHMKSLFEGRQQLRALANGEYDEARVSELADDQGKTIASLIVLRTETRSQIYSILTPDQQSKLSEKLSGNRNHFFEQLSSKKDPGNKESDVTSVYLETLIKNRHSGKMFPMQELMALMQADGKTTSSNHNEGFTHIW